MPIPADPIDEASDLQLFNSGYELLRWGNVSRFLYDAIRCDCWPSLLVAFASNGCSDYFADHTGTSPPPMIEIDLDYMVEQNLSEDHGLRFCDFDRWYEKRIARRQTKR